MGFRFRWQTGAALVAAAALGGGAPQAAERAADPDRFDTVIIDPGHGGEDQGARGVGGLVEKDLVLAVSELLAERLRAAGLRVVMTRTADETVPLETRTFIANDARGDLFVSVHANSARAAQARGVETYFMALEASDEEASRVAERENRAFAGEKRAPAANDPVAAILGDMISNEHLRDSQEFARLAQAELAGLGGTPSRGVKQAPFVVLMGVQMPGSLVEIGFVSNPGDGKALRGRARRKAIAEALARAVVDFGHRYDARRGVGSLERPAAGGG